MLPFGCLAYAVSFPNSAAVHIHLYTLFQATVSKNHQRCSPWLSVSTTDVFLVPSVGELPMSYKGGHAYARQKRKEHLLVSIMQRRRSCTHNLSRTTEPITNSRTPQETGGTSPEKTASARDNCPPRCPR